MFRAPHSFTIYNSPFTIFHMGAHHNPLNSLNQPAPSGPNPLNPHTESVSTIKNIYMH